MFLVIPCHALSLFPLLHINPRPTWRRLGCLVEKLGPQAGKLQLGMWQVKGAGWAKWIESQWIPRLFCLVWRYTFFYGLVGAPCWPSPDEAKTFLAELQQAESALFFAQNTGEIRWLKRQWVELVALIIKPVVPRSNRFFLSSVDQAVSTKLVLAESRNWDTSVGAVSIVVEHGRSSL